MYLRGFYGQAKPKFPFRLGGLRGFYGQPKPAYPFRLGRCVGPCLGDDGDGGDDSGLYYTPGGSGVIQAGGPTYEGSNLPAITIPDLSASGIPLSAGASGELTSAELSAIATTPVGQGTTSPYATTTAATLLAAAKSTSASPLVKQAAAQYTAANPISAAAASALSSTTAGIPTILLLGGGALLLVLVMSKKKK